MRDKQIFFNGCTETTNKDEIKRLSNRIKNGEETLKKLRKELTKLVALDNEEKQERYLEYLKDNISSLLDKWGCDFVDKPIFFAQLLELVAIKEKLLLNDSCIVNLTSDTMYVHQDEIDFDGGGFRQKVFRLADLLLKYEFYGNNLVMTFKHENQVLILFCKIKDN